MKKNCKLPNRWDLSCGFLQVQVFYSPTPTLMVFTGVTNAHGHSPQPTACWSRICCCLSTEAGSNHAKDKLQTYFAWEVWGGWGAIRCQHIPDKSIWNEPRFSHSPSVGSSSGSDLPVPPLSWPWTAPSSPGWQSPCPSIAAWFVPGRPEKFSNWGLFSATPV